MALIKLGRVVDDPWLTLAEGDAVPAEGAVIVGLERWRAEREALLQRGAPLGLRLDCDQPPSLIADDLDAFDVVALEFPKFTDGRAYSSARLLRERFGFEGELRAVGEVLRDQFLFMQRCGFDAFEVADQRAAEAWLGAMSELSVWYQPAADARAHASALRHRAQVPLARVAGGARR